MIVKFLRKLLRLDGDVDVCDDILYCSEEVPAHPSLPDKLSDLIEVALVELEACEKDDRYVVNMGSWHLPVDGKCEVCLAGAVMRIGLDPDCEAVPDQFNKKAYALDYVRTGCVSAALLTLNQPLLVENRIVNSYRNDPAAFKADMRQIVRELRSVGL